MVPRTTRSTAKASSIVSIAASAAAAAAAAAAATAAATTTTEVAATEASNDTTTSSPGKYNVDIVIEMWADCNFFNVREPSKTIIGHANNVVIMPTKEAVKANFDSLSKVDKVARHIPNPNPPAAGFIVDSDTNVVLAYFDCLTKNKSDITKISLVEMIQLSYSQFWKYGLTIEILRNKGIVGCLVYKRIVVVLANHLPELLARLGEDPMPLEDYVRNLRANTTVKETFNTLLTTGKGYEPITNKQSNRTPSGHYFVKYGVGGTWSSYFKSYKALIDTDSKCRSLSSNTITQAIWDEAYGEDTEDSVPYTTSRMNTFPLVLIAAANRLDPENGLHIGRNIYIKFTPYNTMFQAYYDKHNTTNVYNELPQRVRSKIVSEEKKKRKEGKKKVNKAKSNAKKKAKGGVKKRKVKWALDRK
jgi:hypothetical protein